MNPGSSVTPTSTTTPRHRTPWRLDRHADGSLTPISGSPFSIGGAGLGAGLPSQGAIQLSSDGRYLLAGRRRQQPDIGAASWLNGVPQPVGAPVSSGGGEPLSIAVSGNLVYVANAGASAPNITGFTLAPNGSLNPLPGSTVSLPASSGPDDVLIDPGPAGSSSISTTPRRSRAFTSSQWPARRRSRLAYRGARSRTVRRGVPAEQSLQLFVSNAHGGAGNGTVSVFLASGSTGQLASIGASPFADLQTAACWVEISHDGQFLFTVNTASGSISSYSINPDGSLVLLGSTPFGSAGAGAVDARLSPDGRTLLVDGSKPTSSRRLR